MTPPSFRDVEQISALLDGQLPRQEAVRLQLRIAADPELSALYQQLSQSRALLRKLPARRTPRNFTLTPKMVGVKAPTPRSFPLFRFASAFASLLLMLTFAANGLGQLAANTPAAAPAYGMGGGQMNENLEAAAAPEEPISPQATIAASSEDSAEPTKESMRSMTVPSTETMEEQPLAKTAGQEHRVSESPARPAWQVPGWLQLALLAAALLTGFAAWFVSWQSQAEFKRKNER